MQGKLETTLAECYTVEPHEEKRLNPQKALKSGLSTDRMISKSHRNKATDELHKAKTNLSTKANRNLQESDRKRMK